MTKKDYELIAKSIRNYREYSEQFNDGGWRKTASEEMARRLADSFFMNNTRFVESRFLKACGIDE